MTDLEQFLEFDNAYSITGDETLLTEGMFSGYIKDQVNLELLKRQWLKDKNKFIQHKLIYKHLSPSQEKRCAEWVECINNPNCTYSDHKKVFALIAGFFGLSVKDLILEHVTIEPSPTDKDAKVLRCIYSQAYKRIEIPKGVSLIHISTVKDIHELVPSFKSKLTGHYLYPTKRCFFTVMKDVEPNKCGIEYKATYRYRPTEFIQYAYIDPSMSKWDMRSIYVPTDKPIPVELYETFLNKIYRGVKSIFVDDKDYKAQYKFNSKYKYDQTEINTPAYKRYKTLRAKKAAAQQPQTENQPESQKEPKAQSEEVYYSADEDVFTEFSFSQLMDDLKNWKTSNEASSKQTFKSSHVSDEEFLMLKDCIFNMRENENYGLYKQYFNKFCKYCHILPTGTVIYSYYLERNPDKGDNNSIEVVYSYNTKKITIPDDAILYHISQVPDIKYLKPTFRSKKFDKMSQKQHRYFYSSPRVYLTLNKNMLNTFADIATGEKTCIYVVDKKITQAYVDPLVPGVINKAIYVETSSPIKVITLEEYEKKQQNTAQN